MANAIHEISNQQIRIRVAERGAELCELFHVGNQLNYLWKGDPAFWGKTSPVLFPIVGNLRNNTYRWQNKTYTLPRHGFARELPFQLIEKSKNYGSILLPYGTKCDFFRFFLVRGMVKKSKKRENFSHYHKNASIQLFNISKFTLVAQGPLSIMYFDL